MTTRNLVYGVFLSVFCSEYFIRITFVSQRNLMFLFFEHVKINFVVMIMVIRVILASVTSLQSDGNTSQVK